MSPHNRPQVQITLVETQGSSPRNAGARMYLWDNGQSGTIGGGELEFRVSAIARDMLLQKKALPKLLDFPLGPVLGQCCGGFVRVLIEPSPENISTSADMAVLTCLQTGKKTLQPQSGPAGKIEILDKNQRACPKLTALDECRFVLEQPAIKPRHVYIFGAGHIGSALIKVLEPTGFKLHLIDGRKDYGDDNSDDPVQRAIEAPANALFVILTHCHDLDYQLCRCILQKSGLQFCGLIGSATKGARFVTRLKADGLSQKQISKLTCPLGLRNIGNKDPAEIAIAIAAQLLQKRENKTDGN